MMEETMLPDELTNAELSVVEMAEAYGRFVEEGDPVDMVMAGAAMVDALEANDAGSPVRFGRETITIMLRMPDAARCLVPLLCTGDEL